MDYEDKHYQLSNIYLNYFDTYWTKVFGHLGELVRYADDFVILCRRKPQAEEALRAVKWIMDKLELTVKAGLASMCG